MLYSKKLVQWSGISLSAFDSRQVRKRTMVLLKSIGFLIKFPNIDLAQS